MRCVAAAFADELWNTVDKVKQRQMDFNTVERQLWRNDFPRPLDILYKVKTDVTFIRRIQ